MLKRKYARISIVLFLVGVAVILLSPTFSYFGNDWGLVFYFTGLALDIAAFVVRFIFIRCQSCGKVSPMPQWTRSGTIYCHKCGERFDYDK